ncbi:MAG: hypothetical protein DRJ33_06060 [Candidatus Methanomethylicota archaeon]|uniref:Uncharacterized protein n=1 Tax=Thermoproteota archaeon TaxID=2056631 RepID=A0A497EVG6_9CREN|nr:MAG: hypothetical protein DRJ33_06060 [Candidatus Verstraetearchaeota archaeon]
MATLKETVYELLRKWVSRIHVGDEHSAMMSGYLVGELQLIAFLFILAVLFRVFAIPLAVVVLLAVAASALYFAPIAMGFERENLSNFNLVMFWLVLYLAALSTIPLWGGG